MAVMLASTRTDPTAASGVGTRSKTRTSTKMARSSSELLTMMTTVGVAILQAAIRMRLERMLPEDTPTIKSQSGNRRLVISERWSTTLKVKLC